MRRGILLHTTTQKLLFVGYKYADFKLYRIRKMFDLMIQFVSKRIITID